MSEPRSGLSHDAATAPWLSTNGLWTPTSAASSPAVSPFHATIAGVNNTLTGPSPPKEEEEAEMNLVEGKGVAPEHLHSGGRVTHIKRSASVCPVDDTWQEENERMISESRSNAPRASASEPLEGSISVSPSSGQTTPAPPSSSPPPSDHVAAAAAAAEQRERSAISWTGCHHSDPPARYRDTPAYYCSYCSYTICHACFPLLLTDASSAAESAVLSHLQQHNNAQPPVATRIGEDAGDASVQQTNMNWLDDVLHASSTAARAAEAAATALPAGTAKTSTATPPLCHLCRRGHLLREEALLHEWCCEGPTPEERLHRGHNFIYATHNLQKYHFMRAQREARLISTAPLQAQLLSVSPAALNGSEGQGGGASFTMQSCERKHPQRQHTVRDAAAAAAATAPAASSSASLHPTRRTPLTSAVRGHESQRSTCPTAPTQLTCEEGGSFVFSVHNPRLDVQLVWCAVNRQPREEAPSYARDGASGAVTVTPLLLWRCPPSLPGLPARPYRVSIPYGLYAFANVHAVALYETRDIFRKATAQLAASAEAGQRLTAVTVAPSASLRPLLTVSILHHIAATPRPLAFVLRSEEEDGGPLPPRKRARSATPPTVTAGSAPEEARTARRDEQKDAAAAGVKWPDGLGSPELALCVDHLLHGRSVAVYGVASKHFFLHHVASSAALKAFRVVTLDASGGRAGVSHAGGTSNNNSSSQQGGGQRRAAQSVSGGGGGGGAESGILGSPSSTHSVMRQLHSLGHLLLRRVSEMTVLTAEMRAAMTAAAADAEVEREAASHAPHANPRRNSAHSTRLGFADRDRTSAENATAAGYGAPMARALLPGDAGRSPAVARDVTAAMLRSAQHPQQRAAHTLHQQQQQQQQQQERIPVVDVVDVDSSLSSVPPSDTERVAIHTTPPSTPPRCAAVSSPSSSSPTPQRLLASNTPLSQRLHATQLAQPPSQYSGGSGGSVSAASPPPLPSPAPRLFATSQRSTSDGGNVHSAMQQEETGEKEGEKPAAVGAEGRHRRVVVCEELPEFSGPLNSLRLPPSQPDLSPHVEQRWRAAPVVYATDSVRRHVLQALRRQHASRRCVRWVSLPSTAASAELAAQQQQQKQDGALSAPQHFDSSVSLVEAHALRPGWQPPVLLVLHNVDRLDAAEASVLLQLCAQFAFPHPHLQLLLSFDDPLWPLSSTAGALSRLGVCAVQLRRLLLPRVHETLHMRSVHLLTDFEAATAAAAGGGGGGRKTASGSALSSGGNAGGSAATGAGTSHLLQDTLRRVLFSLPPAFNALLRIVLDVQDDVGEGVFVSLFTITERFEASGVMVSQGRLKALLRELTSNRIARYDSAEHALMVPQVGRLRRVLEEVTAQREGGGAGRSGG